MMREEERRRVNMATLGARRNALFIVLVGIEVISSEIYWAWIKSDKFVDVILIGSYIIC